MKKSVSNSELTSHQVIGLAIFCALLLFLFASFSTPISNVLKISWMITYGFYDSANGFVQSV